MSDLLDTMFYITLVVLLPISFCVVTFKWLFKLSGGTGFCKVILFVPLTSGISFIVFQLLICIGVSLREIAVFGSSFNDSFVFNIRNVIVDGTTLTWDLIFPHFYNHHPISTSFWYVELFFLLFYTVLGLVTIIGKRIYSRKSVYKIFGAMLLVLNFLMFLFGIFFWMDSSLYL